MNSTNSTAEETAEAAAKVVSKADGYLAAGILVFTILAVVIGSIYLRANNKSIIGIKESSMSGSSSFEPPAERAAFLDAKGKLDPSNPSELDTLRKMLMRRAVKAIPILLSLQNEGNSIERLYKRGMLTDDMHFKVKDVKNFVDQEFQDVQNDAEELMEGWGQRIWPEAMQFHTMIQKHVKAKLNGEETDDDDDDEDMDSGREGGAGGKGKKDKSKAKGDKPKKEGPSAADLAAKAAAAVAAIAAAEGLSPEEIKAREAEKMAELLLQEEEQERSKKNKKGKK